MRPEFWKRIKIYHLENLSLAPLDKILQRYFEEYKKARNMKNQLESRWITRFLELLSFKQSYGHTDVSIRYKKNKTLAYWVRRQRYLSNVKKIDTLREELLKLAGFNFRILTVHHWDEMFEKLITFKKKYGHVLITEGYGDRQLHNWLTYQRKLFWRRKLDEEKIDRLRTLGVDMQNKTAGHWEKMFEKLVRFKKQHGHLHVCRYYGADEQLVNFVKVNRKNRNTMLEERRQKLNGIGFIWNPGKEVTRIRIYEKADEVWMVHYEELKAYKQTFGTSRVPAKSKEYQTLGGWVSTQRCRKNILSKPRYKLLEKIGFWQDNNQTAGYRI